MRKYNISANLVSVIEKVTNAVILKGEWFRITLRVQGCLLSPTLFNILKKGKVRFAYGIDGLAEWRNELNNLVEQPDNAASAYDKKINAEKTKVITDDKQDIYRDIDIKDKPLEEVAKFKFIGSAISVEGSKQEIPAKTAQISARIVIYLFRPLR